MHDQESFLDNCGAKVIKNGIDKISPILGLFFGFRSRSLLISFLAYYGTFEEYLSSETSAYVLLRVLLEFY